MLILPLLQEREERRKKLKREQQDEGSRLHSQQIRKDYAPYNRAGRGRIKEAPDGMKCWKMFLTVINFIWQFLAMSMRKMDFDYSCFCLCYFRLDELSSIW